MEQNSIESAAGIAYAERNAIPRIVEGLIADCRKLVDDAKLIGKNLEYSKTGQSKDVCKSMLPIAVKLLDLDKRILLLAEGVEKLGQKLLKNGEDLVVKEKFSHELKGKFDVQGQKLESIGDKLQSIGKNIGVIGDKLMSIGSRCNEEDGPKLRGYGQQLIALVDKVMGKGITVKELGIKLQKLEPNVRDTETDRDLNDMLKALNDVVRDLEEISKVKTFLYIH